MPNTRVGPRAPKPSGIARLAATPHHTYAPPTKPKIPRRLSRLPSAPPPDVTTTAATPGERGWVVMIDNRREGVDGGGAGGTDAPGGDPQRPARRELPRRGPAGSDERDDGQAARRVLGTQREPVHRGTGEGRQI